MVQPEYEDYNPGAYQDANPEYEDYNPAAYQDANPEHEGFDIEDENAAIEAELLKYYMENS